MLRQPTPGSSARHSGYSAGPQASGRPARLIPGRTQIVPFASDGASSPPARPAVTCSPTPGLSGLYEAMAGLSGAGDKPFECTGTEEEVRPADYRSGLW